MSRKLATIIKDSKIPGKWKRVAEAYAAFANNDGTNIYPAAKKLGAKAGCSPDTVYRNTPDLIASSILVHAVSHTCRVEACGKGKYHYTGRQGKYTTAYELRIENLQNAERYLSPKCLKVNAAKCRKVLAANCGTDSGIKETPAPASPSLGTTTDSSALTSGSEIESKQVLFPSPLSPSAKKRKPTPQGLGIVSEEEKQNQTQDDIKERFHTQDIFTERGELMFAIASHPSAAAIEKGLPLCDRILAYFDEQPEGYRVLAAVMVLKYNRAHRDHKYATKDDKKLYIRSAEQYLASLESERAVLLNDYHNHEHDKCELCVEAGVMNYWTLINDLIKNKRLAEERKRAEAARLAEEARLAKLCARCEKVPFGKMTLEGAKQSWNGNHAVLKVCDACYDNESHASGRAGLCTNLIDPRPGYLNTKRAAAEAAAEAERLAKLEEQRRKTHEAWLKIEESRKQKEEARLCALLELEGEA